MKKLILIAAVAFFTACGSASTEAPATCDSTKCDSTKCVESIDSIRLAVDSLK
jgi:hypothetical protein